MPQDITATQTGQIAVVATFLVVPIIGITAAIQVTTRMTMVP